MVGPSPRLPTGPGQSPAAAPRLPEVRRHPRVGAGPFPEQLTGCPEHHDQFLPGHEETRAVPGLCQGEKQRKSHRRAGPARPRLSPRPGPAREGFPGHGRGVAEQRGDRGDPSPVSAGARGGAEPPSLTGTGGGVARLLTSVRLCSVGIGSARLDPTVFGSARLDPTAFGSARPDPTAFGSARFCSPPLGYVRLGGPQLSLPLPGPAHRRHRHQSSAEARRAQRPCRGRVCGSPGNVPSTCPWCENPTVPKEHPPDPLRTWDGSLSPGTGLGPWAELGGRSLITPFGRRPRVRQNKQRGGSGAFRSTLRAPCSLRGFAGPV